MIGHELYEKHWDAFARRLSDRDRDCRSYEHSYRNYSPNHRPPRWDFYPARQIGADPVLLEHADCPRNEKSYNRKGNDRLKHGEDFRPRLQNRRISRTKGRAGGEGNKQVIDEAGPP